MQRLGELTYEQTRLALAALRVEVKFYHADRNPRWRPPSLAEVDPAQVETYFAPMPGGDLALDWDDV